VQQQGLLQVSALSRLLCFEDEPAAGLQELLEAALPLAVVRLFCSHLNDEDSL
jgi:hypothetical protein